jgi:hypothetical protein
VFQTGRKEGLYYLVGSKAFALGTVETIGSLARKRLDGKFVVWEATDDGLPGKAPVNVLTFTKWAQALQNFLGRGTGAAIRSTPLAAASDQDFSPTHDNIVDKIYELEPDGYGPKADVFLNTKFGTKGLQFNAATDSDDAAITIDAGLPDRTWFIIGTVRAAGTLASKLGVKSTTDTFFATQQDGIMGDYPKLIAEFSTSEEASKAVRGYLKNFRAGLYKTDTGSAGSSKGKYDAGLYKSMTDILKLNGFKIAKSGELSHASPSAFKNSYVETILNDVMLGSRAETSTKGAQLLYVYAGYDFAGYIDFTNKRIYKTEADAMAAPGPVTSTGPISLDDMVGSPRQSNAPSYPTAATQASAMKKVKINSEIAVTETDFDWLQDEIVKENTSGGKYEDKTPLVKSREIATFVYGKTAPVKNVLKTHVFDIKHIEAGTCLTVTPIATVKSKKTGYALLLVSKDAQPKSFTSAMAGAKFAILSAQLTPAGAVKGKPELVTKVRNMREGMQYLMVGVQPAAE